MAAGIQHDHTEHVDACFRCELSADEAEREFQRQVAAEWFPVTLETWPEWKEK